MDQAHLGITSPGIAVLHGKTAPAIFYSIRRLGIQPLLFQGKRLYSSEQAEFIRRHSRPRKLKPSETGGECPVR